MAQVSEWLELKWWQLVVQALSATRTLGGGQRVLRAAAEAAQRATQRAQRTHAMRSLQAEYIAADLYLPEHELSQPTALQRLADNWTLLAIASWVLGLAAGLWLAGWL